VLPNTLTVSAFLELRGNQRGELPYALPENLLSCFCGFHADANGMAEGLPDISEPSELFAERRNARVQPVSSIIIKEWLPFQAADQLHMGVFVKTHSRVMVVTHPMNVFRQARPTHYGPALDAEGRAWHSALSADILKSRSFLPGIGSLGEWYERLIGI
jgi:hypothetical protein